MNQEKLDTLLRSQTVTAQKVYMVVPDNEPTKLTRLHYLNRNELGFGIPTNIFDGCLQSLKKAGLVRETEKNVYVRVTAKTIKVPSALPKESTPNPQRDTPPLSSFQQALVDAGVVETPVTHVARQELEFPLDWEFSLVARTSVQYCPVNDPPVSEAVRSRFNHELLLAGSPGDVVRYLYPKGSTASSLKQRFYILVRTAPEQSGYEIEAHFFNTYVDVYITSHRVTAKTIIRTRTILYRKELMALIQLEHPDTDVVDMRIPVRATPITPSTPDPSITVVNEALPDTVTSSPIETSVEDRQFWREVFMRAFPGMTAANAAGEATVAMHAYIALRNR